MNAIATILGVLASGGIVAIGAFWHAVNNTHLTSVTATADGRLVECHRPCVDIFGPHLRPADSTFASCLGGIPRQREASDGS